MNISPSTWDETLIKKYSTTAPRYTSYPTALQFDTQFDAQHLSDAIALSVTQQPRYRSIFIFLFAAIFATTVAVIKL